MLPRIIPTSNNTYVDPSSYMKASDVSAGDGYTCDGYTFYTYLLPQKAPPSLLHWSISITQVVSNSLHLPTRTQTPNFLHEIIPSTQLEAASLHLILWMSPIICMNYTF